MKYKLYIFLFLTSTTLSFYGSNQDGWPQEIKELDRLLQQQPYNAQAVRAWIQHHPNRLEYAMQNNQTPLHLLLNHGDVDNFRFALYNYYPHLSLNSITGSKRPERKHTQETILHALCRKGTDRAPDLPDLVAFILQVNPSLTRAVRGDRRTAAIIALNNPHIDDATTLQLLQSLAHYDPAILPQARHYIHSGQPYNENKHQSLQWMFNPQVAQQFFHFSVNQPPAYSQTFDEHNTNTSFAAATTTPSIHQQHSDHLYVQPNNTQHAQLTAEQQRRRLAQQQFINAFTAASNNTQQAQQQQANNNQQQAEEYQARRLAEWARADASRRRLKY